MEYIRDILYNAVIYNHLAWIRFYVKNGADLNLNFDLDRYNALTNAIRYAFVNIAFLVLKYNTTLKNNGALTLAV